MKYINLEEEEKKKEKTKKSKRKKKKTKTTPSPAPVAAEETPSAEPAANNETSRKESETVSARSENPESFTKEQEEDETVPVSAVVLEQPEEEKKIVEEVSEPVKPDIKEGSPKENEHYHDNKPRQRGRYEPERVVAEEPLAKEVPAEPIQEAVQAPPVVNTAVISPPAEDHYPDTFRGGNTAERGRFQRGRRGRRGRIMHTYVVKNRAATSAEPEPERKEETIPAPVPESKTEEVQVPPPPVELVKEHDEVADKVEYDDAKTKEELTAMIRSELQSCVKETETANKDEEETVQQQSSGAEPEVVQEKKTRVETGMCDADTQTNYQAENEDEEKTMEIPRPTDIVLGSENMEELKKEIELTNQITYDFAV